MSVFRSITDIERPLLFLSRSLYWFTGKLQ